MRGLCVNLYNTGRKLAIPGVYWMHCYHTLYPRCSKPALNSISVGVAVYRAVRFALCAGVCADILAPTACCLSQHMLCACYADMCAASVLPRVLLAGTAVAAAKWHTGWHTSLSVSSCQRRQQQ
jgi:hypothetical protein